MIDKYLETLTKNASAKGKKQEAFGAASVDELSKLDVEYLVPGHSTEMGSVIAGKDNVRRNFYTVKMFV